MNERRQSPEARAAWSQAATAPGAGGSLLESTREFAAQALEQAAEKMRSLREGMSGTADAAQRRMHRYAGATSRYVADQPMRAALIAAGIGALVAAAVLLARRRGNRY
ncbi:MAG: hypothetical protein RIS88_2416 [Pseudomonadota bacterium]|jgi:ElaB/YqjD/DUF883 family membrane-anchored ribosome-binding protein